MKLARLATAAALAAGCRNAAAPRPAASTVALVADRSSSDPVVATVDDRPIYASDVAAQARVRNVDARAALDDLIAAEALVGEAQRRGLDRAPEVRDTGRAEMVRRFLHQAMEVELTPASIPMKAVENAYKRNGGVFDHDWYVEVLHILVVAPLKKGGTPGPERAAARAVAEKLAADAQKVGGDAEAFRALATKIDRPVKLEDLVTGRHDFTVEEFAAAAFALKNPGDVSPVVETRFGFHVIYLVKRIPPEHVPIAAAESRLREGLFPEFQRFELTRFANELESKHDIIRHPERLPQ
jgi:peptidyl-prolyl cis-trans isomerase C